MLLRGTTPVSVSCTSSSTSAPINSNSATCPATRSRPVAEHDGAGASKHAERPRHRRAPPPHDLGTVLRRGGAGRRRRRMTQVSPWGRDLLRRRGRSAAPASPSTARAARSSRRRPLHGPDQLHRARLVQGGIAVPPGRSSACRTRSSTAASHVERPRTCGSTHPGRWCGASSPSGARYPGTVGGHQLLLGHQRRLAPRRGDLQRPHLDPLPRRVVSGSVVAVTGLGSFIRSLSVPRLGTGGLDGMVGRTDERLLRGDALHGLALPLGHVRRQHVDAGVARPPPPPTRAR